MVRGMNAVSMPGSEVCAPMLSVRHSVQFPSIVQAWGAPGLVDFRDRIGARHTSVSADWAKGYEADI